MNHAIRSGVKMYRVAVKSDEATGPTRHLKTACEGLEECTYTVDHTQIGDPVAGCGKDYTYAWSCGTGEAFSKKWRETHSVA